MHSIAKIKDISSWYNLNQDEYQHPIIKSHLNLKEKTHLNLFFEYLKNKYSETSVYYIKTKYVIETTPYLKFLLLEVLMLMDCIQAKSDINNNNISKNNDSFLINFKIVKSSVWGCVKTKGMANNKNTIELSRDIYRDSEMFLICILTHELMHVKQNAVNYYFSNDYKSWLNLIKETKNKADITNYILKSLNEYIKDECISTISEFNGALSALKFKFKTDFISKKIFDIYTEKKYQKMYRNAKYIFTSNKGMLQFLNYDKHKNIRLFWIQSFVECYLDAFSQIVINCLITAQELSDKKIVFNFDEMYQYGFSKKMLLKLMKECQ